jgi:hypothetical protein
MSDQKANKATLKAWVEEAAAWVKEIGWPAFKNGEWLPILIRKSFKSYYDNANAAYFIRKYPGQTKDAIIKKLTIVAAKNAAILGAITGAAVTVDEIVALVTAAPSGGLGLPAQITVGLTALAAEAVVLIGIQLKLIAEIAKLLEVPLNPEDPEDILLILEFALGGAGAEAVGKFGAKLGGAATKRLIRKKLSKGTLEAVKRWGAKLGIKILQRSIIKYAVPIVSALIGSTWNYLATMKVGGIAADHFRKYRSERTKKAKRKPRKKTPKANATTSSDLSRRQRVDNIARGASKTSKKLRSSSAAKRTKIAVAARARWARVRGEPKSVINTVDESEVEGDTDSPRAPESKNES